MWIARNKDGQLVGLTVPPMRHSDGYWRGILSTHSVYGYWDFPYPDAEHQFDKLTWEDEPIEVSILPTSFLSEVNHLTDAICGSTFGTPEGMTNGDVLVSMKKINEQLKGICG